jgi:hypothetical protein
LISSTLDTKNLMGIACMAKSLPPSKAGQKREFWTALGTTVPGDLFLLLEAAERTDKPHDDREHLVFSRKPSFEL